MMPSGGLPTCGADDCCADVAPGSYCPDCAARYAKWVADGSPPVAARAAEAPAADASEALARIREAWKAWRQALQAVDALALQSVGAPARGRRSVRHIQASFAREKAENRVAEAWERLKARMEGEGP